MIRPEDSASQMPNDSAQFVPCSLLIAFPSEGHPHQEHQTHEEISHPYHRWVDGLGNSAVTGRYANSGGTAL